MPMSGPSSAGPTTTASEQLDAARAELVAAGERQARIDSEKAAVQQKLDEMDAARKKKGRGRPAIIWTINPLARMPADAK